MKDSRRGVFSRIVERVFGREISARVALAVRALDDVNDRRFGSSDTSRDVSTPSREQMLEQVLIAWRENPLAQRIVALMTEYVVADGIHLSSPHKRTQKFLDEFWKHRLNRMLVRCWEWCDELTRAGELFIALSTDVGGMSYVRAIPSSQIDRIETEKNDIEQETAFVEKPEELQEDGKRWTAYNELKDVRTKGGLFKPVMLHYAINRPVGAKHGQSDLASELKWLVRYSSWLEDRVRLNRFRQIFLFVVTGIFKSEAERKVRERELNANPPAPASILVKSDNESWDVLSPKLDASDAEKDGNAIKKMVAAGSGNPMHFLAEPEGSTRTTAEQAGGPTFRHYSQRQAYFLWMICDVARVVVQRRAMVDRLVKRDAEILAQGVDISARDNAALGVAATSIVSAFKDLYDRGLIDSKEFLRMVYKFAAELVDVEELLRDAAKSKPNLLPTASVPAPASPGAPDKVAHPAVTTDPNTGDVTPKGVGE